MIFWSHGKGGERSQHEVQHAWLAVLRYTSACSLGINAKKSFSGE